MMIDFYTEGLWYQMIIFSKNVQSPGHVHKRTEHTEFLYGPHNQGKVGEKLLVFNSIEIHEDDHG